MNIDRTISYMFAGNDELESSLRRRTWAVCGDQDKLRHIQAFLILLYWWRGVNGGATIQDRQKILHWIHYEMDAHNISL